MKRIIRDRKLSPEEAAKYGHIREQVAQELPDLVRRRDERAEIRSQVRVLLEQLKAAREKRGLSLSEMTKLTGMDRSALSKLESGQRPNPTIETLICYAEAVRKHLVLTLADAAEE